MHNALIDFSNKNGSEQLCYFAGQ